uniref:MYND-type domain-containing protein n=1 Tax=Mycena chlorophos TaxID=658473 RepID=A0ABQ0KU99_MYCCL|nr:predicted protein [Mycena chlorophos]
MSKKQLHTSAPSPGHLQKWQILLRTTLSIEGLPKLSGRDETTVQHSVQLSERTRRAWSVWQALGQTNALLHDFAFAQDNLDQLWTWCLFFLQAPAILGDLALSRDTILRACADVVLQILSHEPLMRVFLDKTGSLAFLVECLCMVQARGMTSGLENALLGALLVLQHDDFNNYALRYLSATDSQIARAALGSLELAHGATRETPYWTPTAFLGAFRFFIECINEGSGTSLHDEMRAAGCLDAIASSIATLCKQRYSASCDTIPALEQAVAALINLSHRRRTDAVWGGVLANGFLDSFVRVAQMDGTQLVLRGMSDVILGGISGALWIPDVLEGLSRSRGMNRVQGLDTQQVSTLGADCVNALRQWAEVLERQMRLYGVLKESRTTSKTKKMCESCARIDLLSLMPRCSVCESAYYCNKICQRANWQSHKLVCPSLHAARTAQQFGLNEPARDMVRVMMDHFVYINFAAIARAFKDYDLGFNRKGKPVLVVHFDATPYTFTVVDSGDLTTTYPTGWPEGMDPAQYLGLQQDRVALDAALVVNGTRRFCWIVPRRCKVRMGLGWWGNGGRPASYHL